MHSLRGVFRPHIHEQARTGELTDQILVDVDGWIATDDVLSAGTCWMKGLCLKREYVLARAIETIAGQYTRRDRGVPPAHLGQLPVIEG